MTQNPPAFFQHHQFQVDAIAAMMERIAAGKRVMLAAAPGSGKTLMGHTVLKRLRSQGARILVLTHGVTELRNNFVEKLDDYALLTAETREFPDHAVIVALPQTLMKWLRKGTLDKRFTHVFVDEAHERYTTDGDRQLASGKTGSKGQVKKILAASPGCVEILLTGNPWVPRADGWQPEEAVTIYLDQTLDARQSMAPHIEYASSRAVLSKEGYDEASGELNRKGNRALETGSPLRQTLEKVVRRLRNRYREPAKYYVALGRDQEVLTALAPTMFVCRDIRYADAVVAHLRAMGIATDCSYSKSENGGEPDEDCSRLEAFKQGASDAVAMVVVNRGTLGFDMAGLMNVVDMSFSSNPDFLWQLMHRLSRVVRGPDGVALERQPEKIFLKVMPALVTDGSEYLNWVMRKATSFAVCLANRKFYDGYRGDWRRVAVPEVTIQGDDDDKERGPRKPREPGGDGGRDPGEGVEAPGALYADPSEFILTKIAHMDEETLSTYGHSNFYKAREADFGIASPDGNVEENIAQLKAMAMAGMEKPAAGTKECSNLYSYASSKCRTYRPDFAEWLQNNAPEWLPTESYVVTLEMCKRDAKRFKTVKEWRTKGRHYAITKTNKWLPECTGHMEPLRRSTGSLTRKAFRLLVATVSSRDELRKKDASLTSVARKRGWYKDDVAHLPRRMSGTPSGKRKTTKRYGNVTQMPSGRWRGYGRGKAVGTHPTAGIAYRHIYWYVIHVAKQRDYLRGWKDGDGSEFLDQPGEFLHGFEPSEGWKQKYVKP